MTRTRKALIAWNAIALLYFVITAIATNPVAAAVGALVVAVVGSVLIVVVSWVFSS